MEVSGGSSPHGCHGYEAGGWECWGPGRNGVSPKWVECRSVPVASEAHTESPSAPQFLGAAGPVRVASGPGRRGAVAAGRRAWALPLGHLTSSTALPLGQCLGSKGVLLRPSTLVRGGNKGQLSPRAGNSSTWGRGSPERSSGTGAWGSQVGWGEARSQWSGINPQLGSFPGKRPWGKHRG